MLPQAGDDLMEPLKTQKVADGLYRLADVIYEVGSEVSMQSTHNSFSVFQRLPRQINKPQNREFHS
jgi:hypothetical protein